jgi:thiol-disulfide isomerase/thioredoxin
MVETWLFVPVSAPDFPLLYALRGRPVLLQFWTEGSPECRKDLAALKRLQPSWAAQGLQVLTVNVAKSDEVTGIYNALYRYLFDRHRDLRFPHRS